MESKTIYTTILLDRKGNNSAMGNPTKRIIFMEEGETVEAVTKANAGFVYGLASNLEGREAEVEFHRTETGRNIITNITLI